MNKPHLKARAGGRGRGTTTSRVCNQQSLFQLRQRVLVALNKLADRDTHQIGVDDLHTIIQCLTPDGISPFLSCILETDTDRKSAIRRECIRLMAILANFHQDHIASHLPKIVATIVKRLKDPDSAVRDACVDTMGVLASKLAVGDLQNSRVFVALAKPLFEVLGEQNKHVQSGSASCLARVVNNTNQPPPSIMQRMLTRTVKLLKNPHFMAKPTVIELNASIIQAGGAPTHSALSAALSCIQESLKDSDWVTRKAAAAALGNIASSGGLQYGSFKSSCIFSLESCRFDKVKPVRDTVLQALHLWRSIGPHTPECSETGSYVKETFGRGGHGDISSATESTFRGVKLKELGNDSVKKRSSVSRKAVQKCMERSHNSEESDWQIEITVPKSCNAYLADADNEESEGSSFPKKLERTSIDITNTHYLGYEYVPMDDKQECYSVSNLGSDNCKTKLVSVSHNSVVGDPPVNRMGTRQLFVDENSSLEDQSYFLGQDRSSLDSTVTISSSQTMKPCCLRTENQLVTIQKQLLDIENKQSDFLDLLKVFTASTTKSLSTIQLKVSGLEDVVDKMAHQLVHDGRSSDASTNELLKKSSTVASPRLSICTSKSSVDIHNRHPLLPKKCNELWEEKLSTQNKLSSSTKQGGDILTDSVLEESRNIVGNGFQKSSWQGPHDNQTRKFDSSTSCARYSCQESKDNPWKLVKGHLSKGDLDSAYIEALHCDSELVLIELLDKTGPVLESLSHKTVSDVLSTLASYFLEQRFMNIMIPWLQQIVELSNIHGPNYIVLPAKARGEFLYSIQEAVKMEFSSCPERRYGSVTQLVMQLRQIWGKCS